MISEITPHHEEKGAQNNACIRLELSYSYRNHADRTDHMEPVAPLHSGKNMETAEPGWNMHCRAPHPEVHSMGTHTTATAQIRIRSTGQQ